MCSILISTGFIKKTILWNIVQAWKRSSCHLYNVLCNRKQQVSPLCTRAKVGVHILLLPNFFGVKALFLFTLLVHQETIDVVVITKWNIEFDQDVGISVDIRFCWFLQKIEYWKLFDVHSFLEFMQISWTNTVLPGRHW